MPIWPAPAENHSVAHSTPIRHSSCGETVAPTCLHENTEVHSYPDWHHDTLPVRKDHASHARDGLLMRCTIKAALPNIGKWYGVGAEHSEVGPTPHAEAQGEVIGKTRAATACTKWGCYWQMWNEVGDLTRGAGYRSDTLLELSQAPS